MMKRDFSNNGYREKIDKVDKKSTLPGAVKKEKSSKRRLSIYDDFNEEDQDDFDMKSIKHSKNKR